MSIKRYRPEVGYSYDLSYGYMEEDANGEYVSYDDHVAEIARLMERCMDGGDPMANFREAHANFINLLMNGVSDAMFGGSRPEALRWLTETLAKAEEEQRLKNPNA